MITAAPLFWGAFFCAKIVWVEAAVRFALGSKNTPVCVIFVFPPIQNRGTKEGDWWARGAGKKKEERESESAQIFAFLLAALGIPYVS